MVRSRNVDLSVCSGDVTDLECRFFTQVLPVNVTIYGKLYLMLKFFTFGSCLHTQMRVT